MKIPTFEDSFEKPAVVEKPVKKAGTHERFKCGQCEERLDTRNCLTNHMISDHNQPGEVFKCDACEFETSRKTILKIHMSKKHGVIEQLDGHNLSYTLASHWLLGCVVIENSPRSTVHPHKQNIDCISRPR